MALLYKMKVFVMLLLFIPKSDLKGIGKISITLPPTTTKPYPGCGVKLDREYNTDTGIAGSIARGTVVTENTHPWTAFLYSFDRKAYRIDVMDLDLPPACKPIISTTTTTTSTTTTPTAPSETTVEITWTRKLSICGGSVIHPRYILTAAHCVACRTTLDLAVVVGGNIVEADKLDTEGFEKLKFLSKIHVFPKYKRGLKEDLKNNPDVALLQLEYKLIFGPKINAICLHTDPNSLYEEQTMIVTGWGKNEKGKTSDNLMEASVQVYPNNNCKEVLCSNGKKCYNFLKR